jgi:hypothetical protein
MEYIITKNEDFGPIVLKEKTRFITETTNHFIKDLETQVGLSVEDRQKILAVMDEEEQKELFYLIDLVKEL